MADRQRNGSGPSWLATLAGALLLIVAGFSIGLVAGAAYEEPSLLVDHLAGETTEVPLPESAPAPVHEDVRDASDAEPEAAARAPGRPVAAPPVSSPPPAGGFAVQVGAFATASAAENLASELRRLGHAGYVADEGGSGARYKVRVGPIASRAEADALAGELKREQRLPTWVLAREPR